MSANYLHSGDGQALPSAGRRRGGWTATVFVIATLAGLTLAGSGWLTNLIVYLMKEFNIKSINAAQIANVVFGCSNFFPVVGAILADSFIGCFSVIWISSLISLLGLILMILPATINNLRPPDCETTAGSSSSCASPSSIQYAVLVTAVAMASIGLGGTRFTLATMGANQITEIKHQPAYFNWYFFTMYFSSFVSATAIVYVEDNVSWGWGLGLCIAANALGLVVFLAGNGFYRADEPRGSPFASVARVVVASVRKRKLAISDERADYYYGDDDDGVKGREGEAPTNSFRSLNRAALKTADENILSPCTVQQVEDLKSLIRILPLWSSSILLSTPIGIQLSLTVLQALATNRHVGPTSFQVPAGSMIVFTLISTAICLAMFDRYLLPLWRRLAAEPTTLQRIGIGHVFNIASMAISALVESKRRAAASRPKGGPMMSVLWLVPQMAITGVGEAFHFPGQVTLYYREFPSCLKGMATAMIALLVGVGFYLSTALIDFVRRVTEWLPDNLDDGRVDNVYWVLVVLGVLNFGYYIVCSWLYKTRTPVVRVFEGGPIVV